MSAGHDAHGLPQPAINGGYAEAVSNSGARPFADCRCPGGPAGRKAALFANLPESPDASGWAGHNALARRRLNNSERGFGFNCRPFSLSSNSVSEQAIRASRAYDSQPTCAVFRAAA